MKTDYPRPTRGYGLLEKLLALERARITECLIKHESRNGTILDIGCGTTPYFLLNTTFRKKFGIDPQINGELSRSNITLVKKSFSLKLPFRTNMFDVIVMLAVFEHIPPSRLPVLIREIHRTLKKGGRLVLTTPSPLARHILPVLSNIGFVSKEEIEEHVDYYHPKKIKAYLTNNGFAEDNISFGSFEMFLNTWACADK